MNTTETNDNEKPKSCEALSEAGSAPAESARIYVGTYAKYNSGSIAGKWLDLEDYSDKDEFLQACAELHSDEQDPEFMFQDYEGIPKGMVSESHISDEVWDWLQLDEDDRELLSVYQSEIDSDGSIESARDAFWGKYDSAEDWAESFLEDTGSLNEIPENLRNYFDFEAYARDARYGGDVSFVEHDGQTWVFHNH